MKLGSSLSLASLLAVSLAACSPATASITETLPRLQLEPGETLEVELRFCIDGPRAGSPFIETTAMVLLADDAGAPASVVARALDGSGEEIGELEHVGVEAIETLELDDEGPWTTRSGRRCGAWQTIRVEAADDGDAVAIEISASMGLDVEDELGEDDLEIEWGEPRFIADDDTERD